jgi:hypothetical protein
VDQKEEGRNVDISRAKPGSDRMLQATRRFTPRFGVPLGVFLVLGFTLPSPVWADSSVLAILEVTSPPARNEVPAAAPPRFVLLSDGTVFVGGTSRVVRGRLDNLEIKAFEKRVDRLRKARGAASTVELGPGGDVYRLRLPTARLDILAKGDPSKAPAALAALATLVTDLASFHHSSLRPYSPEALVLSAREGSLPGGCRQWSFPVPLGSILLGAQRVPAAAAVSWPTGAVPASVCDGGKRYVITLSPVLPY